jgi:hypothetical protein
MICKLKLESLHVESFETTAAAPGWRGTVQAHADSDEPTGACLLSREGGWLSSDPAVCMETGGECNLVTGPVASCSANANPGHPVVMTQARGCLTAHPLSRSLELPAIIPPQPPHHPHTASGKTIGLQRNGELPEEQR